MRRQLVNRRNRSEFREAPRPLPLPPPLLSASEKQKIAWRTLARIFYSPSEMCARRAATSQEVAGLLGLRPSGYKISGLAKGRVHANSLRKRLAYPTRPGKAIPVNPWQRKKKLATKRRRRPMEQH